MPHDRQLMEETSSRDACRDDETDVGKYRLFLIYYFFYLYLFNVFFLTNTFVCCLFQANFEIDMNLGECRVLSTYIRCGMTGTRSEIMSCTATTRLVSCLMQLLSIHPYQSTPGVSGENWRVAMDVHSFSDIFCKFLFIYF